MSERRFNSKGFLIAAIAVLVFCGAFLTGVGMQQMIDDLAFRREYRNSSLQWKRELLDGTDRDVARDIRNQELMENMKHISMENQVFAEDQFSKAEARIVNQAESIFGCKVIIMRDATGEIIYASDIIEPGHYVEYIELKGSLKKGYYPCTAVWDFYTENDEYAGETAWKVVVIIKN